jgi:26S proteasome regulatory subunit N6
MASAAEQVEQAAELADAQPAAAAALLRAVALAPGAPGEADLKAREAAVTALASLLAQQRDAASLCTLLSELRPLFAAIPKAKTAKLVRTVIDAVALVPDTAALQVSSARALACRRSPAAPRCTSPRAPRAPFAEQVELCKEQVEWTKAEKRTFLRHRVELRLASLYLDTRDYSSALPLISACVPAGRPPARTRARAWRGAPTLPCLCPVTR